MDYINGWSFLFRHFPVVYSSNFIIPASVRVEHRLYNMLFFFPIKNKKKYEYIIVQRISRSICMINLQRRVLFRMSADDGFRL